MKECFGSRINELAIGRKASRKKKPKTSFSRDLFLWTAIRRCGLDFRWAFLLQMTQSRQFFTGIPNRLGFSLF